MLAAAAVVAKLREVIMKRVVSLLTLSVLSSFLSGNVMAQDSPSSIMEFGYSPSLTGFSNLTLARPGDFYSSVRLRGLSEDFSGLIADPYTDYMRNPAMIPSRDHSELYGDLGSVSQGGVFMVGGYSLIGKSAVGVFVKLDRLSKTQSGDNRIDEGGSYIYRSSSSSSSRNSVSGLDVRYTLALGNGPSLGASYDYSFGGSPSQYAQSYNYSYFSSPSLDSSGNTYKTGNVGPRNIICFGIKLPVDEGSVQAYLLGESSANTLSDVESDYTLRWQQDTLVYRNSTESDDQTTVREKSGLLGFVYQKSTATGSDVRCLFEIGYSTYDGTGRYFYEREYSPSIPPVYSSKSSTRESNGRIWDVRLGLGIERRLSEKLSGFVALNFVDIMHTLDLTENIDSVAPPPGKGKVNMASQEIKAFVATLPIGFEYGAGEYVTLRGGVEPGYVYGDASMRGDNMLNIVGYSYQMQHEENLWSNVTAGASIRGKNIGEISVCVKYDVMSMTNWSISIMCML